MDSVLDDIGLMLSAFHFDIFLNVSWSGQEEREIEKCEKEFRDTVESVSTVHHSVHGPRSKSVVQAISRFEASLISQILYSRKFSVCFASNEATNKNIPEILLSNKTKYYKKHGALHCT